MTNDDLIEEQKMEWREFEIEMFAHLDSLTDKKGCGNSDCLYCATYAEGMMDK